MATTTHPVRADVHLHRLYAEFAGLPVGVVTQCAQHHVALVQAAWLELSGSSWAERARAFHSNGEECLFDLLGRDTTREARLAARERDGSWQWLRASGPRVLDFGGGLGLTTSLLREAQKHVTYVDVDGAVSRFAAWYLDEMGQGDVPVVALRGDEAFAPGEQRFDLVVAENVLEHVAEPVALAESLARATASGGLCYLRVDPRPATPAEPHRLALRVEELLSGAPTLRAMEHLQRSDDGHHLFRRRG